MTHTHTFLRLRTTPADDRFMNQPSRNLYVYTYWSERNGTSQLVFYDSNGRLYERMMDRQVHIKDFQLGCNLWIVKEREFLKALMLLHKISQA